MASFEQGRLLRWGIVAIGLAVGGGIASPRAVEARPLRGPIMRAERRVMRAQAALDRELARPPVKAPAATTKAAAAPVKAPAAQAKDVPVPAKAPEPAAREGVKQATFDAPAPTRATAGDAARPAGGEPAADGTYSVLVRPAAGAAAPAAGPPAQAEEPLRFPDASTP